jgi:sulfopyruvate decarboxylase TPP-binding subunit
MFTGAEVVAVLGRCGVTHVVWIPDSEIGTWESALTAAPGLRLIRPAREGEAVGIAAGLMLGGARPLVVIQCTGLFEAGDALRNVVHDLKLPLTLVVGVRSWHAHQQGRGFDTCPVYTEPILRAWNLPYRLLDRTHSAADFEAALKGVVESGQAGAVLLPE